MNNNKMIKAKKIEVKELHPHGEIPEVSKQLLTYCYYEFENGLILEPFQYEADIFWDSRADLQPHHDLGIILEIVDIGEIREFTRTEFIEYVEAFENSYYDKPRGYKDLI
jgi:hypothetical protein